MPRFLFQVRCLFGLIVLLCFPWMTCHSSLALDLPEQPPALPTDPAQWINSSPLTYEGLGEKGIVFWYFEESCPKCAKRWPALLEEVEKFADQPVLFVAVNSGCSRQQVARYVSEHRIPWPVLVDPDRSFEATSGEVAISLKSIVTVRMLRPDKKYSWGWWSDVPKTVQYASKGGKWNFDYERVPEVLHFAVRRLEFGDLFPAANAMEFAANSDSREVRRAAKHLREYIDREMRNALEVALQDSPSEDAWLRYQALQNTAARFAPHPLPADELRELSRLGKSAVIKKEMQAAKAVEAVERLLSNPTPGNRRKATTRLQRIVKNYAETHAAERAQELIEKLESYASASEESS